MYVLEHRSLLMISAVASFGTYFERVSDTHSKTHTQVSHVSFLPERPMIRPSSHLCSHTLVNPVRLPLG